MESRAATQMAMLAKGLAMAAAVALDTAGAPLSIAEQTSQMRHRRHRTRN
jgi:hypothetical protein